MNKGGLRKKIITGFFIFENLLIIYIGLMVGFGFYRFRMDEYNDFVYKYLKSASEYIDGDQISKYAEGAEPDEYYDEVLHYLNSTRKGTDIITFCIFVPYEDDLVYLWMSQDGQSSYEWLGKHEGYMENGKETRDATFCKNPEEKVSKYKYEGDTILAGFYPIFDSNGEPVALIDIDLSFPTTFKSIMVSILTLILGILLISVVVGRILYIYFNAILIKPISTLNKEAKHIIETIDNEEEVMTGIHTGDELEELSDSFVQMTGDVRKYINENVSIAAEKERIGADLGLAAKIQANMLPKMDDIINSSESFNLYATMNPAKEVGGDFYDFYMLDDTHLVIEVADVSDKGAAAALFMAISKSLIKARAGMGGSTSEILEYVDNMISEKNSEGMFVTVWFAIIDLETGHVDVCNAGHDYPAIMKADEGYSITKTVHGPPLGFIPGAKFVSYEFTLEPGDRIFLYTDGVNEAKRSDGERFGIERLVDVLNENKESTCKDTVKNVGYAIKEFVGDEPQFDDITMLSFTYEGIKNNDEL